MKGGREEKKEGERRGSKKGDSVWKEYQEMT